MYFLPSCMTVWPALFPPEPGQQYQFSRLKSTILPFSSPHWAPTMIVLAISFSLILTFDFFSNSILKKYAMSIKKLIEWYAVYLD